jgi:hypothetical protein
MMRGITAVAAAVNGTVVDKERRRFSFVISSLLVLS